MKLWSEMKILRWSTMIFAVANLLLVCFGGYIVLYAFADCDNGLIKAPVSSVLVVTLLRTFAMVQSGLSQRATARCVLDTTAVEDSVIRHQRRLRYKSWLRWSRFSMSVTILQLLCAIYLTFNVFKFISHGKTSNYCILAYGDDRRRNNLLFMYSFLACCVPVAQCFAGADVLRWRAFYKTQDEVWKAHYQEVFDHGIREALCCLGRFKYLSASEDDEVYSVARLLGDLVSYRASGRGHLELLTGLALLHKHKGASTALENMVEAPKEVVEDAFTFHKFAEAAYTGPLLDFGRHTVFFSCAWLYRQGILTPWLRRRRPLLAGDNWWRGHAAAFTNYVCISPQSLRYGRVSQAKCEAAYFVVVLHHLKSLVIAVRGTETPEDLLTDGLGRECPLNQHDFPWFFDHTKHRQPALHYGHSGIIEAARELHVQLEGNAESSSTQSAGVLASLLGNGCECEGFQIRIVGHSLGGAIATCLGLRLHHRYPDLHVYAYGPLPCLDFDLAEACSSFVTSIIHDNEFSSRLSVSSVLRLRAAAIEAIAQDHRTDSVSVLRLARRFLYLNDCQRANSAVDIKDLEKEGDTGEEITDAEMGQSVSKYLETVSECANDWRRKPPELYLPGRVVHLVPLSGVGYGACLASREWFLDIVVSPSMFLDHLPWRCHRALRVVLSTADGGLH